MSTPSISEQLKGVPDAPGVYAWKDAGGTVLYIGKAKSLRKRMRSYLSGNQDRPLVERMMPSVAAFDYYVTENEVESLILEASLIKQLRPRCNVDYKDDKSFPFIAITTSDPFPAIKYTREKPRSDTRYFGPYTDAKAARETIEVVRRVYRVCSARCVEWKRVTARGGEPSGRACFDYHVGKGSGPCIGAIALDDYARDVADAMAFLEGRRMHVERDIEARMRDAADSLEFERAARLRNSLDAVRASMARQVVVSGTDLDADVFGVRREETVAGVHELVVREGRVIAANEFVLDKGNDVPLEELVEGFLLRHYGDTVVPPPEVIVPGATEDPGSMEEWLSRARGKRVRLRVPARGVKKRLLDLAEVNAGHTLARYKHRTRYEEARANAALIGLKDALGLPSAPMRIECFDISTLHGRHSVGSMVVFEAGGPSPASYRRFRVRAATQDANDVLMLGEVLRRRFARREDGRFASTPDLVIVDGGKPQLGAAVAALRESGADGIPVVALAKREEELFVPGTATPLLLSQGSPELFLVKRVRDEAHRFAITYHRETRGKAMTASALDHLPGIGPKRKKALLKTFGSLKRLAAASATEIAAVPGIPADLAEDVAAFLAETRGGVRSDGE